MNADRLHAILISLNNEMEENELTKNMQNLVTSLQAVVNASNPTSQQNLSTSLKSIYTAVTDTTSDSFSPTWRQILSEIGGEPLFGRSLKLNIETIFARNQITPAVALQELQQLLKQLKEFEEALQNGMSSLTHFKIGDETLSPGECEIGILIPRVAVSNRLLDFAEELEELGFILNTFAEVATGSKDDLTIKTISSSELLVYLNAVAPYAACLAVAIERTVSLYKQLLEIRKLRQELGKQGVPDTETTGIEDYANNLMKNGIEKISVEIVAQFYKKKDDGRKNELKNSVRISLNRLANRIDKGFNMEVRVQPLANNDQTTEAAIQIKTSIDLIQKAAGNMQFLKLDGQPILKLPEGREKKEVKDNKKDKKDKKEGGAA